MFSFLTYSLAFNDTSHPNDFFRQKKDHSGLRNKKKYEKYTGIARVVG